MEQQILPLFDEWNAAIQSGNPDQVVALYATDGILIPTVSNQIRHNHAEIRDYFAHFLVLEPVATLDEHHVREFGELAINSGIYTFRFANPLEGVNGVTARYTFVYQWRGGRWLIIEHHSSRMPEG